MLKIIATDDFVTNLKEMPIKNIALITSNFVSIEEIPSEEIKEEKKSDAFIIDLIKSMKSKNLN